MNLPFTPPRQRAEEILDLYGEIERRLAKADMGRRGYIDEHGVLQGGLMAFIRYYWRVLEPAAELVEGWALYAIVLHLEAVSFGEIRRLLITVPPGFMKSLCTDVFWPAWEWGPMKMPHRRYVAFSYSAGLTERDNGKFKALITHDTFQALFGAHVTPVKVGETRVSNTKHGWKLATSVGGLGTGERGDVVILDDAHNIKEAESDTVRTETVRWFRESMSDRLNDMTHGIIVVIMQRSHREDVAGAILDLGLPYEHLMIPMEYDPSRQVDENGEPRQTAIGWFDPRYEPDLDECDGVLAWPERFPPNAVVDLRAVKGPYAYAGQYQQAPAPRGGGIFQRDWWQPWDSPDGKFPMVEYVLASVDSAFTEKEANDPTAMTVWGIFVEKNSGKRRVILLAAWRKHLAFSGPRNDRKAKETYQSWVHRTQKQWGLVEWIAHTCRRFKVDKCLIEGKASGISASQVLEREHMNEGWAIELCAVKGDKMARALGVQATFSQLMVYAPDKDWAEMVIDEMADFPRHKYDDLTDSTTQAIKFLRDMGMLNTDAEVALEEYERGRHRSPIKPIYPV